MVASNMAMQPWSHNCPIKISNLEARFGKMWDSHIAGGSCGSNKLTMWVDCSVDPSGRRTEMPGFAGCLL
jgi:hypothetical protein